MVDNKSKSKKKAQETEKAKKTGKNVGYSKYMEDISKLDISSFDKFDLRGRISDLDNPQSKVIHETLTSLSSKVSELKAESKSAFKPGLWAKLFRLDKVGSYVGKYKQVKVVIDEMVDTLENAQKGLYNDNITMGKEIEGLKKQIIKLESVLKKLDYYKDEIQGSDLDNELKETAMFTCLQKITDTQQRIGVSKQAVLAISTIVKNNTELIISVDRAKEVTLTTLALSVMICKSLQEQGKVANTVEELNGKTGDLLIHTSEMLKTQGVLIQKQASSAMLDGKKLEKSFNNCLEAYKDISKFRQQAIKELGAQVDGLKVLLNNMDGELDKVEVLHDNTKRISGSL